VVCATSRAELHLTKPCGCALNEAPAVETVTKKATVTTLVALPFFDNSGTVQSLRPLHPASEDLVAFLINSITETSIRINKLVVVHAARHADACNDPVCIRVVGSIIQQWAMYILMAMVSSPTIVKLVVISGLFIRCQSYGCGGNHGWSQMFVPP